MFNDQAGKNFQGDLTDRSFERDDAGRDAVKVLVVDPVLGSRFSLLRAASQPGFRVDACASASEAKDHLARNEYALVIADEHLVDAEGLDFLEEAQSLSPETARALVTSDTRLEGKRAAIERAALVFLLSKPWDMEGLRRTLRELFGTLGSFAGWDHVDSLRAPGRDQGDAVTEQVGRRERVLRGVLAGLNSCCRESEVFELLHAELSQTFGRMRWLWVDEGSRIALRLAGDWAIDESIELDRLTVSEKGALHLARRNARISRLDGAQGADQAVRDGEACIGLGLRVADHRLWTGLVWTDRGNAAELVQVLRESTGGLQLAVQRIREADARSQEARELARRVSEELRMPVGALTHAVDVLRGEAERAGLPVEWMERISSESERVARAVEHLEGEMLRTPWRGDTPVG